MSECISAITSLCVLYFAFKLIQLRGLASCRNNNTVQWLKSTLLLKIECWETHIYKKQNVYKQSECSIVWDGKEKSLMLIKRVS